VQLRKNLAGLIIRKGFRVIEMPSLMEVLGMPRKTLVSVLRHCPESDYFYKKKREVHRRELTHTFLQHETIKMILKASNRVREIVVEARASEESSSSNNSGQNRQSERGHPRPEQA